MEEQRSRMSYRTHGSACLSSPPAWTDWTRWFGLQRARACTHCGWTRRVQRTLCPVSTGTETADDRVAEYRGVFSCCSQILPTSESGDTQSTRAGSAAFAGFCDVDFTVLCDLRGGDIPVPKCGSTEYYSS